ncbi:MAG: zf-HC2 domain-containing protein [Candidatus Omnitrophica bacterium]|nr:zf-HC2 domain-containing protein [Candidatus Omnitrophota bacterium]
MKTPSNWEEETSVPLVTSCKQAARLVSLFCERRLSLRELLSMRIHLFMCKTCARYRRQISALRQIFIRHQEVLENTPPSDSEKLSDSARQKIKVRLADQKRS